MCAGSVGEAAYAKSPYDSVENSHMTPFDFEAATQALLRLGRERLEGTIGAMPAAAVTYYVTNRCRAGAVAAGLPALRRHEDVLRPARPTRQPQNRAGRRSLTAMVGLVQQGLCAGAPSPWPQRSHD